MKKRFFIQFAFFLVSLFLSVSTFSQVNKSGSRSYLIADDFFNSTDNSARDSDNDLVLGTNGLERMRILKNGKIGIGTSNPLSLLHVKGGIQMEKNGVKLLFDSNSGGPLGRIGTNTNHSLALTTNGNNTMYLRNNGNVGIGLNNPLSKLHVAVGAIRVSHTGSTKYTLFGHGSSNNGYLDVRGGGNLEFRHDAQTNMSITSNGNIGIGTSNPGWKLHVLGGVHVENSAGTEVFHVSPSKELVFVGSEAWDQYQATQSDASSVIQTNDFSLWVSKGIVSEDYAIDVVEEWDDYVFDENYALPSLETIAAFVKTNKHLPNIPSADEVKANGYSLHDLNRGFLKTIEEMTLYTIAQQAKIDALEEEVNELKKQVEQQQQLAAEVAQLKALIMDMKK